MDVRQIKLCHVCKNFDAFAILVTQTKTGSGAELGWGHTAQTCSHQFEW